MTRHLKNRMTRAFLAFCLVALAGTVPASAEKTKAGNTAQAAGSHFSGRSPSYTVSLQVSGEGRTDQGGQAVKDQDGYVWFDPCAFRLTVEQSPPIKAFTYDVAVNATMLGAMDLRLTMGDGTAPAAQTSTISTDGSQPAVPAECQKLPEELQRFVSEYKALRRATEDTRAVLEVREASFERTRKPVRSAEELVFEDEQRIWELQHIAAPAGKIEAARQRLAADQQRLNSARTTTSNQTRRLQEIDALRRELAARDERLQSHRFALNPDRAHITVGGKLVSGDQHSQPWVTVEVREE